MTVYKFSVYGLPGPQGSKRHVGGGRMIESSAKVKPWREAVKWAAIQARNGNAPLDEPLAVMMAFAFIRPASAPRRITLPAKRPDLDKLIRSTSDALTDSGIWRDDSLIVCLVASKMFVSAGPDWPDAQGVWLEIGPLTSLLPTQGPA